MQRARFQYCDGVIKMKKDTKKKPFDCSHCGAGVSKPYFYGYDSANDLHYATVYIADQQ